MIIKTTYTRKSAIGWIGYIAYKSRNSKMEKEMKGVFNGLMKRATKRDIEWIANAFQDIKMARMIIFSPATYIAPIFLSEYTWRTLWRFINEQGRNSVRFVYALHYNTPHPHTHAILSAYFPDDMVMWGRDIEYLNKIARDEFKEDVGVYRKIDKQPDLKKNKKLQRIAEFEKQIEREHEDEEREMNSYMKKIKTVDDVMKEMEIGL